MNLRLVLEKTSGITNSQSQNYVFVLRFEVIYLDIDLLLDK